VPHDVSLIATIAAAFGLALLLGVVAVRLRLPALIGYLVAGIAIGPATPGFVADLALAQQLAEIGVMLLMFGVGLHFSVDDLLAVRRIALPGAIVQIAVATALGAALTQLWGWSLVSGLVFGLALSVASTVVLLRALENRRQLESVNGRIAVGWLVVEDLAMVLALVLLPSLAGFAEGDFGRGDPLKLLALTVGQVGVFVVLMLVVGRRLFPWLLWQVARTGSRELFTLCVIAAAVGLAFGAAGLFDVSFALGAFLAGTVIRGSALAHRAAAESLPLRDAFAVLFFVSVGMLFDPSMILREPQRVLAVVGIIVLGKSVAAFVIVLLFRYPLNTALTVSASLAQIGEFSFILAGLGVALGVLPAEGRDLILAGALISIALNPFVFGTIEPLLRWARARSSLARALERRNDPLAELPMTVDQSRLTGHVLLVGHGRIGARIARALLQRGIPIVVAERNRDVVEALRARGVPAVSGDATDPGVLVQAHVARARVLVIAAKDPLAAHTMIETARMLRPEIRCVVRAPGPEDAARLEVDAPGAVFHPDEALARAMLRAVLGPGEDERSGPGKAKGSGPGQTPSGV
jgi:CPA2 family monovalent cation:H+ antiporter-2